MDWKGGIANSAKWGSKGLNNINLMQHFDGQGYKLIATSDLVHCQLAIVESSHVFIGKQLRF